MKAEQQLFFFLQNLQGCFFYPASIDICVSIVLLYIFFLIFNAEQIASGPSLGILNNS